MRCTDLQLADLQQLIAERQLLLILGEGVSHAATGSALATWRGLLLDGITRCANQPEVDADWCTRQRPLVEKGKVNEQVSVAGHIEEELGGRQGGELLRWLRETLGSLRVNDTSLLQAIASLECPLATTSIDTVVADALGLPAVSWDQTHEVERLLRGDATGVLHLHGCWRRPESLVLGVRDRVQLSASPHASAVLTALRTTRSLLFLGCGERPDPNIAAWLRWSGEVFAGSEYRNYRLEPDAAVDSAQRQHPSEQRLFVLGYGVSDAEQVSSLRQLSPRPTPPPTPTPALTSALLSQLRQASREAANVLPGVFHMAGGPDALSEIAVELVLRPDQDACGPDALHPRARERTGAFGRRHPGIPSEPFPLAELLRLEHRRWMILGDPGGGKTTSLRRLVLHIVDQTPLAPLLLRIGEVGDVDRALDELVPGAREAFWAAAERGEVVLLVDGLDEATDPVQARKALVSLSARLGPSLLVVTSRGATYEPVGGRLRELMLCPLSPAQQERLLAGWLPPARHPEIPAHLDGLGGRMARLAENPLILTLIARLLCAGLPLPRRRVALYGEVLHLLLTRGHSPDLHDAQRPFEESVAPMMVLGWLALHGHGLESEQLTVAELRARLKAAPEEVREALGGEPLERWLRRLSAGAGLLEPDRLGATWSFAHRTFREYLAAAALRDEIRTRGGVARCGLGSELDRRLSEAKAKPALWAEVFALLTGLLAGGEAEVLVQRLVDSGPDYKPLLFWVLADAEGLKEETVWGVLGLAAGRGAWQKRSEVLQGLPALVGDLGVAARLLGRFGQAAEHGADLWWAHHLLVEIAAGRLGEGDEEARAEAALLGARLLLEHRPEARLAALTEIERRGWWKPIPAGWFKMGSTPETDPDRYDNEGLQHEVEISRGFDLLAVPVTNALYEQFDPGHRADRNDFKRYGVGLSVEAQDDVPVYNVSWYEAEAFAAWLGCRLPSETEWEHACRAGTTTRFWSGSKDQDLYEVGWVLQNSGRHPHPVATPPKAGGRSHPWGLHDLHGNVWEWCADPWEVHYYRVIRGGGWGEVARGARSACRHGRDPRDRNRFRGFRLVRVLPES